MTAENFIELAQAFIVNYDYNYVTILRLLFINSLDSHTTNLPHYYFLYEILQLVFSYI